MRLQMNNILKVLLAAVLLSTLACKEESLFDAQACLNRVDENVQADVLACLNGVQNLNSPEANAIKCSILLTAGGITTARMVNAFKQQDSGSESSMMTDFSFNKYPTPTENKTKATEARDICKLSGEKGLIGISSFSSIGTLLCKGALTCSNASPAAVNTLLDDCATLNNCSQADKDEIGETVIVMNEVYCSGANTESTECQTLSSALVGLTDAQLADPAIVADTVLLFWKGQQ